MMSADELPLVRFVSACSAPARGRSARICRATHATRAVASSRSPIRSVICAEEAARRFDIPEIAASHLDLVGRDDIDVIDVCTPSHTHFELAWAALEAGKHVLCEKPVAYDFRDTLPRRGARAGEGAEDQARLHLPLQPRRCST